MEAVTVKVAGSAPLDDLGDTVLSVDDRVQLLSIYTVTAVRHEVDSNTGNLTRVQVLKPVEMHLMPFDKTDPNDDGIIRAIMPGRTVNGGSDD